MEREITFPPASEREARMDDPNDLVSPRPGHGTRLAGLPIPSGGPFFLPRRSRCSTKTPLPLLVRLHSPDNRNICHSQHVFHFRLLQPRSIVLKLQPILFLVEP